MREIVIVIADLYLPPREQRHLSSEQAPLPSQQPGAARAPSSQSGAGMMPGIGHVARFGARSALESGWRDWLARWLGRDDLVGVASATIAASAQSPATVPAASVDSRATSPASTVWIATPVHLIAGLTGLHVDHRSMLRLPAADVDQLAADFQRTFRESGFSLEPLPSGDFLMRAPSIPQTATTEPARSLVSDISGSLPQGAGATILRRLGAEIEMWLHEHPVNETRARRGEPPVSTLWLWGGGPDPHQRQDVAMGDTPLAFGQDPFVRGLWKLLGAESQPLPAQLADLFSYPPPQRPERVSREQHAILVVVELAQMLHSHPTWTLHEALADLDQRYVSPALQALHRGAVGTLVLLANDRQWRLRSMDRFKLWRRPMIGLKGLQ